MRKRTSRVWIPAIILLVVLCSAAGYIILSPPANASQTNAKNGYVGDYTYVTSYAGLRYVNKFSVSVTGVSGNSINFVYVQTESANASVTPKQLDNYSLAFDPAKPSTFESGSALPLFVANYLKAGNGTSELPASGNETALPFDYSVSIASGITRIQFTVGSSTGTEVNWNLAYNETTGFLINGYSTLSSSLIAPSTFEYTLTAFSN